MKYSRFILFFMLVIVSLFVATCLAVPQQDRSPESIFYRANSYYEEGRYGDAIEEYTGLLDQGLESGSLYFNLGNSYFKEGELGLAILNYERAKRLIPRDGDVISNFQFAQSKIADNVAEDASWIKGLLNKLTLFTINEVAVFLSILWTSLFLFLIAGMFAEKVRRHTYVVFAILIIISLPFAFSLYSRVCVLDREAIILSESAEARFEPQDTGTTHFTLYEGMKIYVLNFNKEWIKIRRHDGKVGWINDQDMEKI